VLPSWQMASNSKHLSPYYQNRLNPPLIVDGDQIEALLNCKNTNQSHWETGKIRIITFMGHSLHQQFTSMRYPQGSNATIHHIKNHHKSW